MKDSKFGIWFITIINVLLALAILGSLAFMIISFIHFYNEAKGLMYAKEFKKYAEGLAAQVQKGNMKISEMDHLARAFNQNLGNHKLLIPSTNDPVAYATFLSNQMDKLFHDSSTQHAYIKALLTMVENKNHTLNSINGISSHDVAFSSSAIKLFNYVDTNKVMNSVINHTVTKTEVLKLVAHGMGKWFIDDNELMFIGLLIFLPSWLGAIAATIILKTTRKTRGLKGGFGIFLWALFMPVFGFIFYPLLSFSYIFRKK